jgi:MFS transporter, FHS family, L-fucose permease
LIALQGLISKANLKIKFAQVFQWRASSHYFSFMLISEPQRMKMYKHALVSLSILFFMMGFITCLNDILVPYMKEVFKLSYTQAALVQFCFFGAYGLTSIPASNLIARVGYQKGMVTGFAMSAVGCFFFYPAVAFNIYEIFLVALFILASGIVMLQVAANPFVAMLGTKATASSRLSMVQAFNSFGTFLAPFFGSYFILSRLTESGNGPTAVRYPLSLHRIHSCSDCISFGENKVSTYFIGGNS